MTSPLRQPACWLVLLIAFSFANAFAAHRFQPTDEPDTANYEDFDWSSLSQVLSNNRTPGYPLFLDLVQSVSSDPRAVPFAHWLMLIAASLVLYRGLVLAGYAPGTATFAAGAVMLSRGVLKFGHLITADSLAISMSIAATGCFFATFGRQRRLGARIGLTLCTFLTYQIRPAYLFLIPLWPLLGFVFDRLIVGREAGSSSSLRRGAQYALATVVPFLSYCSLRMVVVGHFGLVSFGGYNFVGVVGQFLDAESVERLSPDSQQLAREMLRRREELDNWEPPRDFLTMERMYNPTVWDLAVPAADAVHGDDPVAVNGALTSLGRELLAIYPGEYARWLQGNAWHALGQIVQLTALDRATYFLALLLIVFHARNLWRGPGSEPNLDDTRFIQLDENQRFLERHLLCWSAFAFTAASALLVILVEPANDRYMTGSMTLLPAALAVVGCLALRMRLPAAVSSGHPEK